MIEKKFYGLFVAAILLAGPLLGSVPAAFAAPPTLEEKCAKQTNAKKSPDCELLQRLNDLEEELKAKDMELMEKDDLLMDKDTELMDKDMALMDKDMQLMDEDTALKNNLNRKIDILSAAMQQDDSVCDNIPEADKVADTTLGELCDQVDVWVANYQALCNNVPLFDDAIGIVNISVLAVLGATNSVIDEINEIFTTLHNKVYSVNINPPGFNINPPSFSKTITIPVIDKDISFNINVPSFGINPPGFNQAFGTLTSFVPASPIPSIPTNVIGNVDTTLDQVADCSII